MSKIITKPSSPEYRKGWKKVFGKKIKKAKKE